MRIAINIVSSYARFLIGAVAVFFLTPFILEAVGVEHFGLWSLCLAIIGVLGLLDLGLGTATVKYAAECSGRGDIHARNEALSTLMLVYAALGFTCLLLVAGAVPAGIRVFGLGADEARIFQRVMTIGGSALALAFPLSIFRSALIGAGRFDLVNGVETGIVLLNVALVVTLLNSGWALTGLVVAYAAVLLVGPLLMAPIALRVIPGFRLGPGLVRLRRLREVAPLALYFMLANVAVLVTLRSDALLIKGFLPLSAVAAYAIAARISEYSYLLNKQFSNALMPLVSRSSGAGDHQAVRAILVDGTRLLMIVATPLLGLLFFHAESIVLLWVGPEMQGVVLPLRVLLVAVFFSTFQFNAANVLGMTGGHRGVAWIMVGSAVLNLSLSLLLIPRLGLAGAAVSTLVSAFILEFGLMMRRACRNQGVSQARILLEVLPVIGSAVPMVLAAQGLATRWSIDSFSDLALHAIAAAAVYAGIVSLVGLKKRERALIAGLFTRAVTGWQPGGATAKGQQHG